jgi:NTE family protein
MALTNEEQAIVLSGGGANGAFEVGVVKALAAGEGQHFGQGPLDPRIISGTSVGAINAALLASDPDDDFDAVATKLVDIWRSHIAVAASRCGNGVFRFRTDPLPYADPRCLLRNPLQPLSKLGGDGIYLASEFVKRVGVFLQSSSPIEQRLLEFPEFSNFTDTGPLRELLREFVDLAVIRNSEKRIRIVATDWRSAAARVFNNGDLTDEFGRQRLLGSASIPGIFPAVVVGEEILVDGGVVLNTPLEPAILARDPTTERLVIHMVYLDPLVEDIPIPKVPNSFSTINRLTAISLSSNTERHTREVARTNLNVRIKKHLQDRLGVDAVAGGEHSPLTDLHISTEGRIPITVHRYRPSAEIVGDILDLFDFGCKRVDRLIAAGAQAVQNHDCASSNCELS